MYAEKHFMKMMTIGQCGSLDTYGTSVNYKTTIMFLLLTPTHQYFRHCLSITKVSGALGKVALASLITDKIPPGKFKPLMRCTRQRNFQ